MLLVNFSKKISLLFLRFSPEFQSSNIFAMTEHTRTKFFSRDTPKIFFQNVPLDPIRRIPKRFQKFGFFIVEICILSWDF